MGISVLLGETSLLFAFSVLSCFIAYYTIPVIIRSAEKKHLFDQPDNDRKLHTKAIPTLGGIAIFLAFLLSFSLSPWAMEFAGYSYLVSALLILFFVGLKDDLVVLSAYKKLSAQIVASGLVVFGCNIIIDDFYGVIGLSQIHPLFGIGITFFTIIVVINAVNLIDGIDGLAGGIAFFTSILFGSAFLFFGKLPMAIISFSLAGALFGFLYYNFSPASIFMGDTGSMILGFLLSIQAIEFIALGGTPEFSDIFGNAAPVLAVTMLAYPLYDTLRVVIKRCRRKKSIFDPGQDHVHHELLRMGMSHRNASLLLYGESLALIGIVTYLSTFNINVNILLGLLLFSSTVVYPTNGFKRRMIGKIFGFNWEEYRRKKWGLDLEVENSNLEIMNDNSENHSDTAEISETDKMVAS